MSKALSVLSSGIPVHLQKAAKGRGWDKVGGVAVPRIAITTKHIKAVIGDQVVAKSREPIEAVLLDVGPLGRSYYAEEYDPEKSTPPTCYSLDTVRPAKDAEDPQSSTCDTCPMAVRGSSRTQKGSAACRYRQNLAVALPGHKEVFRLSLNPTSLFSKEAGPNGELGLNAYVQSLKGYGVTPSMVFTELSLNEEVEHAQLQFRALGYIDDPDEFEDYMEMAQSPALEAALQTGPTGDVEGAKQAAPDVATDEDDDEDEAPAPRRSRRAAVVEDDDEDEAPAPRRSRRAAVVEDDDEDEAPAPRRSRRAAVVEDDDEDEAPAPRRSRRAAVVEDDDEDEDEQPKTRREDALANALADALASENE